MKIQRGELQLGSEFSVFRLLEFDEEYIKTAFDYLQSYKYFHKYRDEVREILRCSDTLMDFVSKKTRKLFRQSQS